MNPPDISTPETENPPEPRAVSRTAWRLGPLGIAAMVVLVLADTFAAPFAPDRQVGVSVLLGLSFGQVGAMIVLASAACRLTWQWLIACYAATLIMCLHFSAFADRLNPKDFASLLTLWVGYTTLALATIQGLRWYRHSRGNVGDKNTDRVQFSVWHLMVLMTIVAGLSLLIQYALPNLVDMNLNAVYVVVTSAVLIILTVELRRRTHQLFWQFGGLAAMGVVACVVLSQTVEAILAITAVTVQVAVLALVMAVLELETMTPIGGTDNSVLVED